METTKSPAKTPVLVLVCRNPPSFEAMKEKQSYIKDHDVESMVTLYNKVPFMNII